MKKIICLVLSFIAAISLAACDKQPAPSEEKSYIVKNGSAEYSIIVPDEASEAETYAAQELKSFMSEAIGNSVEVYAESRLPEGKKFISVGKTTRFGALGKKLDEVDYNYDGFIIENSGEDIYIAGANDRGTTYGCYEFLERFFGVRFLDPSYTYVPKITDVEFASINISEKPVFRFRNYFSGDAFFSDEFKSRTRMYSGEKTSVPGNGQLWYNNEFGNVGHNSIDYVRPAIYNNPSDTENYHPEFFASTTNVNLKSSGMEDLCYCNGITEDGELDESMDISVAKVTLESLKKYAVENPDASFFFIGIADHMGGWCMCEKCNERAEKNVNRTSEVLAFSNVMAKELQKWSDEKYGKGVRPLNVGFFAYFWCETAPVKFDGNGKITLFDVSDGNGGRKPYELADNLWVRIAPLKANYGYSFNDERQTASYRTLFEAWGSVTENLMVWDYMSYYNDYFKYFPNISYMSENIKKFADVGVKYCMQQGCYLEPNVWQERIKYYVVSKLYWKPDLNVEELIKEFLSLYYGAAADSVWKFMEIMENHYAYLASLKGYSIDVTASTKIYNDFEYMPLGLLKNAVTIIEDGEAAIGSANSVSEAEKDLYLKHLANVKCTPLSYILTDYDNYFADRTDYKKWLGEYERCAYLSGVSAMSEGRSLNDFLNSLGA